MTKKTNSVGDVWHIDAERGQHVSVSGPSGDMTFVANEKGADVVLDRAGDWSAQLLTTAGNASGDPSTTTAK